MDNSFSTIAAATGENTSEMPEFIPSLFLITPDGHEYSFGKIRF